MALLDRNRRVGGNLRGMGFAQFTDELVTDGYVAPSFDPASFVASSPNGSGEIISDPIAPPAPNVTPTVSVTTESGGVVALPAMTTPTSGGANPTDGSAPISSPMNAPDNTSIPAGSYVTITPNAWVIGYPDGSGRTIYLNAPPPNDAPCVRYDTNDINNGLICQLDETRGNYVYIPTEMWTGQVQSWGELRANMETAARLNYKFPEMARRNVWVHNPSWHFVGNVWDGSPQWNFADDFVPEYIGPTESSGGASMYVVDPDTGDRIDVTNDAAVTPEQEQRITDLLYGPVADRAPGQPGYTPPVYSGPPIDETGSVITPPNGSGGGGPRGGGGVSTTVNISEPAANGNGGGGATLVLAALGALLLLSRKR